MSILLGKVGDFLRVFFSHAEPKPSDDAEDDGDGAGGLRRGEKTEHRLRIVASEIFKEETRNRIQDDIERKRLPFCVTGSPV